MSKSEIDFAVLVITVIGAVVGLGGTLLLYLNDCKMDAMQSESDEPPPG